MEKLLDQYGVHYETADSHKNCRKGWIALECPYCSDSTEKYLLGWNLSKKYFYCWACGWHNGFKVLKHFLPKVNPAELIAVLNDKSHQPVEQQKDTVQGVYTPPKYIGELDPAHQKYLRKRKFDPDHIAKMWKVQGISLATRLSWSLFIPIHDSNGVAVSWTTRALRPRPDAPKYVSASPEEERIHHKSLLYGEHLAGPAIVIVEGPTDAWRIGPGAVATFGLSYSQEQFQKMLAHPLRIVCYDNAPVAQKVANKLADALSLFPGETYNVVLSSDDPGDASPEEVKELRRMAFGDKR